MRLITLNTWANRIHEPVIDFVKREAPQTDIFCFQEVYHTTSDQAHTGPDQTERADALAQFRSVLDADFFCTFAPVQSNYANHGPVDFHLEYGNATFVRRTLEIVEESSVYVYRGADDLHPDDQRGRARRAIVTKIKTPEDQRYTIINLHGLWQAGTNKADNPDRFEQSRRLRAVIDQSDAPVIIAGDFNLLPDGQSMAILEEGMRNLIKEYNVTSTRSSLYPKPIRLADYILVSPEIKVIDFKVLEDEVSDHLPLALEWK